MRRTLLIAAAVALAALAGRLSAAGHPTPAPPRPGSPGPTRLGSGGVGVGYAHSRAGALAASAGYAEAFADPAILRKGGLRKRIEAVATPAFAPRMMAANEAGARRLAGGPIGEGLRAKLPTAYFGVPVLYRLLAYSPRRAVIRTWGFTVLGNATTAEPAAYFGTSRTVLAWRAGDWKIAASRAAFGPTPRLLSPREGGEGFALIDLMKGMRGYVAAP